jgi:transcriptional regulator
MAKRNTDPISVVQGTLDMLIMKTVALQPLHGYGIGMRIQQISGGAFEINPGSLFPALHKLERAGLLTSDWQKTENGRRAKYYSLSHKGRTKLQAETRAWEAQTSAIARILNARPEQA